MKWSWRIGAFAGIGVYVHATFLLLIGWIVFLHLMQGKTLASTLAGIIFILALFACVVLHEFGHALTARRYGIKTRDITLLPIGGVARLEKMPDDPRQELWVALAGPAVNVVIAILIFAWLVAADAFIPLDRLSVSGGPFLERLMFVNVFLAGFNMLPAFPMDGGRVLRALLGIRMEYTRATHIAATTGQAMALLFGFVGLFTNPFLLFIALFVWIGAAQESSMVQMRSALGGIPVEQAMMTDFEWLSPNDTLGHAAALVLAGSQQDFPVKEGDELVGVLVRGDLMKALARKDSDATVASVMRTDFQTVYPSMMLESAVAILQTCDCQAIPVSRGHELVGLLTMDNVGEFIMIHSAMGRPPRNRIG